MAYSGGKGGDGVFQRIINQMGPHETYLEPFLGGGSVMKAKRPARSSIGIDADPAVIEDWKDHQIPGLAVCLLNSLDFLEDWKPKGDELVYLDPPYLFETRRQNRPIYRCELNREDHLRLLAIIKRLSVPVMISGYWSQMYATELQGWRTINFQAMTRGGKPATEWVWMNFPEPIALHDYRFLGENFRKRQDIKRKIQRWVSKLEKMPMLERRVLTAALGEVAEGRERDPHGGTADAAGGIGGNAVIVEHEVA